MPSQKVLEEKKRIVEELKQKMQSAAVGVLVDYCGLTVEQDTKLRRLLREADIDYKVVKNTLTRFAAGEIGLNDLDPILNGPTSMAVSMTDPVAPAKILYEFSKKNDKLEIKAGFMEGRVISIEDIKELATLPSRETLVARALAGFNAPITGFVNVLNGNLRGLAVALNAIAEKKAAAGE